MASTNGTGDGARGRSADGRAAALHAAWRERVSDASGLGEEALSLLDADARATEALVSAALAWSRNVAGAAAGSVADEKGGDSDAAEADAREAAANVGRAAGHSGVDFAVVHAVFGELREALFATLVAARADEAGGLRRDAVERCAGEAKRAVRPMAVAVGEAWFDERSRTFRHDIKTPLQAASLNLELLALESAGTGIDSEALDVIQRSLDQAVELVQAHDPAAR